MNTSETTVTPRFRSLRDLQHWCSNAPQGTLLRACVVAELLATLTIEEDPPPEKESGKPEVTWRERLWVVPAETRLGTTELAEAVGRPKSWIYSRTQAGAEDPLPHRKLDGMLVFTAGEIRAWLRDHEKTLIGGRMDPSPEERKLHAL